MTKITLELIENSIQRTNPLKDRELDLKGNKIALIENLGTTLDQFDSLDFTDNEIHRFDGFPYLKRLASINFTNNKIVKISKDLNQFIPNITTLVFTNNNIQELREIDNLSCFKDLEFLALLKNPIVTLPNYRLYVIYKLPQVRILDFSRVKDKERKQAAQLFAGKTGEQLMKIQRIPIYNGKSKSVEVGSDSNIQEQVDIDSSKQVIMRPSSADMYALRAAIQNATTMEEVDRLNFILNSGKYAGFASAPRQMRG